MSRTPAEPSVLAPPAPGEATPAEQRRVLALVSASTVVVLAAFVTPLATGVRTAADLGTGAGGTAWLLSAMSVGLAAALLVAGTVADDVGRRRVFVAGLVVLAVGAAVCAAAPGTGWVVAGRLVQGVGGAAVLACSLGLIAAAYPVGPGRARAAAVWGACIGAGTGVGGLATVVLDGADGWRATYAATAVLALAGAAAARWGLPETPRMPRAGLDVAGAVLLVGTVAALLTALVALRSGTGPTVVALLFTGSGLLAVALVVAERRAVAPLVEPALFRVPGFVAATVGALVTGAAVVGLMSYLPTVLQRGLGDSLLAATVLVLVWSAVATVVAVGLRWVPGVDGRLLLAGALAVSAAGIALLAVLAPDGSWLRVLPGMVVLGAGYGAANAALGREAVAHVPAARASMGSGANNTARYVGAALGVTVVVLAAGPAASPAGLTSGWNAAALGGAAVALAGALAVLLIRPARR
ncbi:MFS transporter [Blastococcus sp. SYSU D00820]